MTNSSHSKSSSTPYSLNAEESSKQYKNKYSDRKLLGEGGMGQVFELKDLQIQRPVAIKMMKPELQSDPKAEQRFINEARITGRLEHPNIIPIHELSRNNDGLPYYTTKLIKGLDLKDILIGLQEEEPKFIKNYSLNNLISIFLKVCDAIAFSHSQNIIHRDLKLENIMIGEFGEVLVVDWGLAKDLSIDESTDLIAKQKQTSLTERVELTLDGEIVGTGIEITMDVEFTVRVHKGKCINWPRGEDRESIFTVGNARPLDYALQIATAEMLRWLQEDHGLDALGANVMLGQCVEYDVGNVYDPAYTMVCKVPKRVLDSVGL